jgi:subtilisin family serine protease
MLTNQGASALGFATQTRLTGPDDNFYNITGVAPQASILVYRVYSCSGATFDSLILSAMERAFNEGADIINLSLGRHPDTSEWADS